MRYEMNEVAHGATSIAYSNLLCNHTNDVISNAEYLVYSSLKCKQRQMWHQSSYDIAYYTNVEGGGKRGSVDKMIQFSICGG